MQQALLLSLLGIGLLWMNDALAQSSLVDYSDLPIVRHEIRRGTPLAKDLPSLLLAHPGRVVPQRLAKLPLCRSERIRRTPVGAANSLTSSAVDLFVFAPSEERQMRAAEKFTGQIVPFTSGARYDPAAVTENPWLSFALTLDIRCLPTRFSFEIEGATRFAAFHEGEEALGSKAEHLLKSKDKTPHTQREQDGPNTP